MNHYKIRENIDADTRNNFKEYSDILSHLLFHRGIKTKDEAGVFLSPSYDAGVYDPYLLHDMEKAVTRILGAIENKEKICIYSDYDADGIPGAVVLHDLFKKIGYSNFINYIPDRSEEGFGLHKEAMEKIAKEEVKLMITVDCGIADKECVDYAKTFGIDTIITDHHLPNEKLPNAFAIVNPKISPKYPDQMICGAGVAYKLAQGVLTKNRFGLKEGEEKWLLDMVGIATLSDMVPLVNENRCFAYFGLKVLRKSRRIGLIKLLSKLKIDQSKLTEDDVGFMITPRINAASRMGISYDAFKLLTTTDQNEADILVDKLEKVNKDRKTTTAHLVKEVKKHIEAKYSPYFNNKVIVAGDPTWKPSLLGLVANSLAEKEGKPVFLWGRDGIQEALKGSCRGVGEVSVTDIMTSVAEGVFNEFGGHHLAGGFSVSHESIHLLEGELERAYEKCGSVVGEIEKWADSAISLSEVDSNFVRQVEMVAPFGTGNPKPLFLIANATVESVQMFGKTKEHLKVLLLKPNGGILEAISFFASEKLFEQATGKKTLTLVGVVERSFFLNKESIRVRIEEIID
ncbi:MAG: single-stranded-DNA-specific exonuclease RecJ [Patescibacteria group bacterium]